MITINEFKKQFAYIRGKTIALVYIFEGDTEQGFSHFYVWKSNIIARWLVAIEEIHCLPLIIDVRTFVDKALNKTLPHIDYVLNLNSGTIDLSSMALVPSVCSSISIPCIPCNAITILSGEHKNIANHVANSLGINVPCSLPHSTPNGIFRPLNLGNSMGVKRGWNDDYVEGVYQEFIVGLELTTPVVYNPMVQKMDFLPSVIYLPKNHDANWYNSENAKKTRDEYYFKTVELSPTIKTNYTNLIKTLSVNTYCRIDSRIKSTNIDRFYEKEKIVVSEDEVFFIEINVMPTIRKDNNFDFSYKSITEESTFYPCIQAQKELLNTPNVNSFLLTNAMMAFVKTMY